MTEKPYESFGRKSFGERTMQHYLPHPVFTKWKQSVLKEEPMDRETADAIAHAMKTWALENGVTHYSHWFIPMTGSSAEKHDAFLEPDESGSPLIRFSGKNLIKGETDGSSFPNGGLRQTFEARGYTYWDVSSPAFIRGHVLFIPSIFISFHGDSLDEKAPLIKAMDALNIEATRVLHALGDTDVSSIKASVGLEQEYFLIKKEDYLKRDDLVFTGRTLLGARPPKDQELVGHYFSAIPSNVVHYMEDVNEELWKLGIYSKVEHNEVAPCQFEIAVVFSEANVAIDQNMILMETLQRVALKHGMVALLHEKPFSYINGSGKHNNFSLITNTGINLFDPGDRPFENTRFLTFVCALVRAVDTHATLLRFAASSGGNDHRLGASEAPPAIISMFVGSEIGELFSQLEVASTLTNDKEKEYYSPLSSLRELPKDVSDRNRTSPFAFTGNKFEFRMPGSSICSAFVNTTLCTIIAESLGKVADALDAGVTPLEICKSILNDHNRVIFNGDGYTDAWIEETQRRGLPNMRNYVDACAALTYPSTVELFETHNVLSRKELEARSEIAYGRFIETMETEANTLNMMVRRSIIPAVVREIDATSTVYAKTPNTTYFEKHLDTLTTNLDDLGIAVEACENAISACHEVEGTKERAETMQARLRPHFSTVRAIVDALEKVLPESVYPYPTYTDILFK